MTFINYASKEINCKIVYYGPGLCGKTTNLQYIYNKTAPESKGKMISLATEADRTLFFYFLPLDLGSIRGFTTRFHLYTVPGQVFYDASRKLILKGVDGVIFVADSQGGDGGEHRIHPELERTEGARLRLSTSRTPCNSTSGTSQTCCGRNEMYRTLNFKREPTFEAVAPRRRVFDTLKSVAKQILIELKKR